MAGYAGKIDVYFTNVMSPKTHAGKRFMRLKGSFGSAYLWFLPESTSLPDNKKRSGQDAFDVYYHRDDWEVILDVLRNETPVYFEYHDTNNAAQIYTGDEPVGEEEA